MKRPFQSTLPYGNLLNRLIDYHFHRENGPESPGQISDKAGIARWRYQSQPHPSVSFPESPFSSPDLILCHPDGQEALRVRRHRRFPAAFSMLHAGRLIGIITPRILLRNGYTIDFYGGARWLFRLPQGSIHFSGASSAGNQVWVILGASQKDWVVLVEPEANSIHLLGALAFIHREWSS